LNFILSNRPSLSYGFEMLDAQGRSVPFTEGFRLDLALETSLKIKDWFTEAQARQFADVAHSYDQRVEAGHHRLERRQVWSVPVSALPKLHGQVDWQGLQCIVMVERTRRLWNKTTRQVQLYLSSLPSEARALACAVRQHWGVENGLHWELDVSFGEDACRVRRGHAPENLSLLRRLAVNALGQEQSARRSLRHKSNRAAMDDNYMLTVLRACLPKADCNSEPVCQ
jgi:predicted transposase YbfD/YdcC